VKIRKGIEVWSKKFEAEVKTGSINYFLILIENEISECDC